MEKIRTASGVQNAVHKDGTPYYRASVTYKGKHLSLGSFDTPIMANTAYLEARGILDTPKWNLSDWKISYALSFTKCVTLVNFRDQGVWISTPILLKKNYFLYYLSNSDILTFDIDDLFYYSTHSIMRRGKHLFVSDYGSQISILSRYRIPSYAVAGRDYYFVNGDPCDLRYGNVQVINRYRGVRQYSRNGFQRYKAVIHVKSNYLIGSYDTEIEAAVAYNKAADLLIKKGVSKNYEQNYIEDLSPKAYADTYIRVPVSKRILNFSTTQ